MDEAETRKRHGVRYDTGPTVGVGVAGLSGGWNGGVFSGDAELVAWAREVAAAGAVVTVFGRRVRCGSDSAVGAVAALASFRPGRARVVVAPGEVLDALRGEPEPDEGGPVVAGDN